MLNENCYSYRLHHPGSPLTLSISDRQAEKADGQEKKTDGQTEKAVPTRRRT